jgi:hypothetical protein
MAGSPRHHTQTRRRRLPPLIHTRALTAIHFPAAAALLFSSKRRSRSGTTNSALPQFKQISTCGKINTWGLSRFSSPVKWMAISAGNFLSLSDLHDLHLTVRPHGGPRRQKEDANARREQTTTDLLKLRLGYSYKYTPIVPERSRVLDLKINRSYICLSLRTTKTSCPCAS